MSAEWVTEQLKRVDAKKTPLFPPIAAAVEDPVLMEERVRFFLGGRAHLPVLAIRMLMEASGGRFAFVAHRFCLTADQNKDALGQISDTDFKMIFRGTWRRVANQKFNSKNQP